MRNLRLTQDDLVGGIRRKTRQARPTFRSLGLWIGMLTVFCFASALSFVLGAVSRPRHFTRLSLGLDALRATSLDKLTVAELKEQLKAKGLATSGKKADLIERLSSASDASDAPAPKKSKASKKTTVAEEEEPSSESDFASMSVATLKEKCKEKGLATSGKKPDLVARLQAAPTATTEDEEKEEKEKEEKEEEQEEEPAKPAKASKAKKETSKQETSEFLVGDKVDALYDEEEKTYQAIVQRDNEDGTFTIMWTEGGESYTCKTENMKLKARLSKKLSFQAGDPIVGLYHEDEKWYPGRIKSVNDGGSYTVFWDEGGDEYEIEEKDLKAPVPKIKLNDLMPGQKYSGRVGRTFNFGTFVDFGAERDGLVRTYFQFEEEELIFKEGDKVQAKYEEDEETYAATVTKVNKDGTYELEWDEGGEPYTCEKKDMTLWRVKALEEGEDVEVFIDNVVVQKDGQQRVYLALYENKVGAKEPKVAIDLTSFENLSPSEWLKGTVAKILPNLGALVKVKSPAGVTHTGLVHITQIRDGFVEKVEDEVTIGQEVDVCVISVDVAGSRLSLSMKQC